MNNSEVEKNEDLIDNDDNLRPDCQEGEMDYLIDDYDGHAYLLCPNIDCRAKIWVGDIDEDE